MILKVNSFEKLRKIFPQGTQNRILCCRMNSIPGVRKIMMDPKRPVYKQELLTAAINLKHVTKLSTGIPKPHFVHLTKNIARRSSLGLCFEMFTDN